MDQHFTNIHSLIQKLDSPQIKSAEKQLLTKCQSKKGLHCLSPFLIDPQLSLKQRKLTASLINLILTKDNNLIVFEQFAEKYLLGIIADWTISFQIKLMMLRSIQLQIVKTPNLLQQLYELAQDAFAQIETISDELLLLAKDQSEKESQIDTHSMTNLQNKLIQGCQVIIGIGYWIVSFIMVLDKEDRHQNSEILQYIPTIINVCSSLHKLMVGIPPSHIVCKHLLEVYSMINEQNAQAELINTCWSYISQCTLLPNLLKDIYLMDASAQSKRVASMVHLSIIRHLYSKNKYQQINIFFDEATIQFLKKQCIQQGSSQIYQINQFNKKVYHLIAILQYYYQLNTSKINLTDLIQIAQTLVFPIIHNCFTWYEQQIFSNNPAQMYRILQVIMNFNYDYCHVLAPLAYIISNFVRLQINFFLYLFQRIRHSLQTTLKCQNKDGWQLPQYLQNKEPLQIDIFFFLMPYIQNPSQPQLVSGIYFYLSTIITPAFLNRLQSFDLAMFYYFMESSWHQIYKDNMERSYFLLNYLFKKGVHSSSKYFIYQCIYKISHSVIDIQYLMGYAHNLPQLKISNNKWKIILKWISLVLVEDLQEDYLLKLITTMREYLDGVIYTLNKQKCMPSRQIKGYIDVLTIISRHTISSRAKPKLQRMLLTEFTSMYKLMDEQIQDSYYSFVTQLTPLIGCLQNYEILFIKYLYPMLEQKKTKSRKFYFLLAQYIFYLTTKEAIINIYEFIYSTISINQILKAKNVQQMQKVLFRICDCMILLQNIQLKHWDQLQKSKRQSTMALIQKIKRVFIVGDQKINKFEGNEIKCTILQRLCIIQLLYLKHVQQYNAVHFRQLSLKIQALNFREYDAKLLIDVLGQFNCHVTKQNRRFILQITKIILMKNYEEIIDLQRKTIQKRIYFLTRKMSASNSLQPTIYRQVKKFMTFYCIPIQYQESQWTSIYEKALIQQKFLRSFQQLVIASGKKDALEQYSLLISIKDKQTNALKEQNSKKSKIIPKEMSCTKQQQNEPAKAGPQTSHQHTLDTHKYASPITLPTSQTFGISDGEAPLCLKYFTTSRFLDQ